MSRERKERDQKRGGKYNVDNIDDRGRGIVDFIPCMNYPSNVEFFKTEKGERYVFDFVPYVIKTENHPLVASGKKQIGDLDYMFSIAVHTGVGANNEDIVCLKKNYRKI